MLLIKIHASASQFKFVQKICVGMAQFVILTMVAVVQNVNLLLNVYQATNLMKNHAIVSQFKFVQKIYVGMDLYVTF